MNKIIILSFLIFLFNFINTLTVDLNNNNNTKSTELPKELWREIGLIIVKKLKKAKTLLEIKEVIQILYKLSSLSKDHDAIVNDLVNIEFNIDGKKIILKEYYAQRKNEIIKQIKQMLENKSVSDSFEWFDDINAKYKNGMTVLMYVAFKNDTELAELLIQNGANLNDLSEYGNTALIIAVMKNNKKIAELLIENGTNLNIKNQHGNTALMFACINGYKKISKLLLKNGANPNIKDDNGKTALMYAVMKNNKRIAELLIENGANLNIKDNNGYTALTYASFKGYKEIAKLLMQNGAFLETKYKSHKMPVRYKFGNNFYKIMFYENYQIFNSVII